ncbi:MAG: hypothetical protein SGJ27_04150 [Candidatus Melainabacteria bacterium]|nr:hypothetical protein [Candidatus Melainabacteria bacterium]
MSQKIRVKTLSNCLIKAGLALSMLVSILVLPLALSSGISDFSKAEARSKKTSSKTTSSKSSPSAPSRSKASSTKSSKANSTKSKSSRSAKSSREDQRETRSSRSSRSSREERRHPSSSRSSARESKSSKHERVSTRRDRHGRVIAKPAHRAHHHEEPAAKLETVVKPPAPNPEAVEANSRRESSYQTMARAYRLYDEGINARISGDFNSAVGKLNESHKLFNNTRGYQRTGESSLQEALVHYELGQACEGAGDILSARDSYVRCLNIRPTMVEASIRLVSMLATAGQWQLALAKAKDAVQLNPNDPRAHHLMSLTLDKTGHKNEARAEAQKAKQLLKVAPKYKPFGIDAVWRRTHKEDGTPLPESETGISEDDSSAKPEAGKSDVDNPDDVMGVENEEEMEEEKNEKDD